MPNTGTALLRLRFFHSLPNILTHEFPDDLRGGLVLRLANLLKLLSQLALHPDAQTDIFVHRRSVTNGYTFV